MAWNMRTADSLPKDTLPLYIDYLSTRIYHLFDVAKSRAEWIAIAALQSERFILLQMHAENLAQELIILNGKLAHPRREE